MMINDSDLEEDSENVERDSPPPRRSESPQKRRFWRENYLKRK
jgi:hypothetical protein